MSRIFQLAVIIGLLLVHSCKKDIGANPYDPKTPVTVSQMPKVSSFAPLEGKIGDEIIIKGINFTTATGVSFGGKAAASFNVTSDSTIAAIVAEGSSGTVSVTNHKGSKSLAGFIYIVPEVPDDSGNLALNKPATASESFNAEGLSVDGDLGTRWSTVAGDNQWYKVDLLAVKKINKVKIFWEGAYASDYAIQVSTDDVNYTTVFSTTAGAGGDVTHEFTTADARYVKILLSKAGTPWPMSFWEFEIYADVPPVNLALNKSATASESFNSETLALDGDLGSRWSTVAGDNHWYQVDLGSVQQVGKVKIFWEGAFALDYALQLSTDGTNFTTVYSTTEGAGGDVTHEFTPADARYVKILLNKAGTPWPMSFWEFEVYKN